ncbi:hybrid sensor histidine kinase/response regulator [Magnetococcus sp. PR-3]|uniref:hybrid sensor histidine kinase/response regulator n=1 Tax=Magnetococcus sp. PR-3 TaxID=3120355 RepID=UPI002FCDED17
MDAVKAKILIVDDEKSNIDILVDLLAKDYKTLVAKSGAQALKRVMVEPPPDLVLLDIMMPEMDGFEVCTELKQNLRTKDIPVIFVTGMDRVEDETRGLEVGAVDFIRKPFNTQVVLARVQTHLHLQQQKRQLMDLNALKNRFLGMAAHDLRNPLSSINGLSDMMLHMPLSKEENTEFITTIHNVSGQMLTLLNDLLDVSVIESGTFELKLQPGDFSALVQSRVRLLQMAAKKKSSTIEMVPGPVPTFAFDTDRMIQVIDNLISNAIKFSPPGSHITVGTGQENDTIFLAVQDEGPGLSEEDKTKLFGTFQKLSAQPTGHEKSTGLGLSIVKKIVDAHGGHIRVESHAGEGAIFTVLLQA